MAAIATIFKGKEKMIRSALLLLVFSCSLLRADLLDDVSRQLDLMEGDYWVAQRSNGDYHRAVQRRLDKLKSDVYRIWHQMRKVRKHNLVKFDVALNALSANFGKLKPSVVQAFYFSFKKTFTHNSRIIRVNNIRIFFESNNTF